MTRGEHGRLSEAAVSELAAIDTALRGEPVTAEHGELADLALALRDDRPSPEPQFAAHLDRLAARGFRPSGDEAASAGPASRAATAGARSGRPARGLRPAFAVAVSALVAIALVIAFVAHHAGNRGTPDAAIPASGSASPGVTRNGAARSANPRASSSEAAAAASALSSGARQVETGAALNVGVAHAKFASADQQVFSIVSSFHGYVQQSSSTSGGEQQGSASFQLRVPSTNSAGAIAAISQLGRVLSETNTTNDVTDRVGSLQRSLGSARAQRAGLLRQLATTSSPRSEGLRARLSEVEAQISQDQASLRSLDNNVAFATIALTLTGERPAGAGSSQGDLTPGGAVRDSGQILSAALAVFLLAVAATLPVAIALLLAWLAVVSLRRRQREQTLDAG